MNELYDVYDRGHDEEQSHAEREYAQTLLQAVVMALTQATVVQHSHHFTGKQDANEMVPLGEVRVWLLEMVVRPSALSRQLAFTLFLNLSITTTSVLLASHDKSSHLTAAEQMQTRLFRVLMEMLSKAVVVAASSSGATPTGSHRMDSHAWIDQAVGCFLLFAKQGGCGYRTDRLNAIDPHILRFFLHTISSSDTNAWTISSGNIDSADQLVELLVFTLYAQEGELEQHSLLLPVTTATAVDRFGGLDLLLFHFYNTHSLSARRLLLAVFFDVTYASTMRKSLESTVQQTASSSSNRTGYDQLWRYVVEWDLATYLASTPSLFTAGSTTRTMKKLYAPSTDWILSETQVQHFFNQLRILIHVDEYYAQSSVLKNTIQLFHDQDAHNVTEVLMAKVTQLLSSNRIEDKFQGERWLAELITYGLSCEDPSSSKSNNSFLTRRFSNNSEDQLSESVIFSGPGDVAEESMLAPPHSDSREGATDLEETCCFDEDANIRIAAGSKFWELAKSASPIQRESFVRILTTFVRRRLRSKNSTSGSANLIHEINICLNVMQQQRETHARVLISLVVLLLDVCKRNVSYPDKQKQRYDRNCARDGDHYRQTSWHSDSLASRSVEGTIALDSAPLKLFPPAFSLYPLGVLHVQVHSPQSCRQRCCGKVARSLVADVLVCTAMIVTKMPLPEAEMHPNSIPEDAVAKLVPLMHSCDTRVAIIVAKRIMSTLKHADMDRYQQLLCDLHTKTVEDDDAARLASSYLFAQELLLTWVHSSS